MKSGADPIRHPIKQESLEDSPLFQAVILANHDRHDYLDRWKETIKALVNMIPSSQYNHPFVQATLRYTVYHSLFDFAHLIIQRGTNPACVKDSDIQYHASAWGHPVVDMLCRPRTKKLLFFPIAASDPAAVSLI